MKAMKNAYEKLQKYYSRTSTDTALDEIYAFSTLLHPGQQETAFTERHWDSDVQDGDNEKESYRKQYLRRLRQRWEADYRDKAIPVNSQATNSSQSKKKRQTLEMKAVWMIGRDPSSVTFRDPNDEDDELTRYLRHCKLQSL